LAQAAIASAHLAGALSAIADHFGDEDTFLHPPLGALVTTIVPLAHNRTPESGSLRPLSS